MVAKLWLNARRGTASHFHLLTVLLSWSEHEKSSNHSSFHQSCVSEHTHTHISSRFIVLESAKRGTSRAHSIQHVSLCHHPKLKTFISPWHKRIVSETAQICMDASQLLALIAIEDGRKKNVVSSCSEINVLCTVHPRDRWGDFIVSWQWRSYYMYNGTRWWDGNTNSAWKQHALLSI